MKDVLIIGSGAVAAELTSYIENHNSISQESQQLNVKGYLEEKENIDKYWAKYDLSQPVLNNLLEYEIKEGDHFLIGIADISFRLKIIDILKNKSAKIIGFIHCSTIVSNSATIGEGNIIYPYCIIGPNAKIGDHNLITSYSFISHDCKIGNNNFLSTSGLSGNVTLGNNNYMGIRSTILPYVSIGNGNTIQAGMIVDKNVADDSTVFHRFKEKVIAIKHSEDRG